MHRNTVIITKMSDIKFKKSICSPGVMYFVESTKWHMVFFRRLWQKLWEIKDMLVRLTNTELLLTILIIHDYY